MTGGLIYMSLRVKKTWMAECSVSQNADSAEDGVYLSFVLQGELVQLSPACIALYETPAAGLNASRTSD